MTNCCYYVWLVWKDQCDEDDIDAAMKQYIVDDTSSTRLCPNDESCTSIGDNGVTGTNDVGAVTCDKNKAAKCDEVCHNANCSDTNVTIYESCLII